MTRDVKKLFSSDPEFHIVAGKEKGNFMTSIDLLHLDPVLCASLNAGNCTVQCPPGNRVNNRASIVVEQHIRTLPSFRHDVKAHFAKQARHVLATTNNESEIQELYLALSEKLSDSLAKFHEEWVEPELLTGKTPPIDATLISYVQLIPFAKELIALYESESPKLPSPLKQLLLKNIRDELRQISHAHIDFVHGPLYAIQESVLKAQCAFEAAKQALLFDQGNLDKLVLCYHNFRKSIARLQHLQKQCIAMSQALLDLKKALPSNRQPKSQSVGWLSTMRKTIASIGHALLHPSTYLSNTQSELTDNEERLAREYHALIVGVEKDVKTMSLTLYAASIKGIEISRCENYFIQRLQKIDPQGDALTDLLKTSSEELYATLIEQELQSKRDAFYTDYKQRQAQVLQDDTLEASDSRKRILNLFFFALHAGSWIYSFQQVGEQGAFIAKRAARLQGALKAAISPKIQKSASFLGKVLTDNFYSLQEMSESELTKFTKRYPETYEWLNAYRIEKQSRPTADKIFATMQAFTLSHLPQQIVPTTAQDKMQDASTLYGGPFQVSAARRTHDLFLFSFASTLLGFVQGKTKPIVECTPRALDYGNKHKNLIQLHDIIRNFGVDGVRVPLPFGLASEHVEEFLRAQNSIFFDAYKNLVARCNDFIESRKAPTSFLENSAVIELMATLQQSIIAAFIAAAENPSILETLPEAERLEQWLQHLREQGAYLMVRSTGQEDSSVANAGGNLSVNYVLPTLDAVLESAGKVIASYFSMPSIRNLLLAKVNPFKSSPCLAVTIQELIGEPIGGAIQSHDIPISCILFSNEPYYTGTKLAEGHFRALRISCSFGHGEAVVGNQGIGTDTVLVLQSRKNNDDLNVLYDNQEKPQRLAPLRNSTTGAVSLTPLANPEDFREKRTLDLSLSARLFDIGVRLEKAFGYPVDVELVIKNGVIHLVQARPINRKELLPTYIDVQKIQQLSLGKTIQKTLSAKVVVQGLASALVIRTSRPVLIADTFTLEKAQELYKEKLHVLIIIGKDEPANSHPVINFSGLGVPVLYHPDIKAVRSLVAQVGQKQLVLAVCMQEGTITLWDETHVKADALISHGYVSHPSPMSLSLSLQRKPPLLQGGIKSFIPPDLSALLYAIRVAESSQVARQSLQAVRDHPFTRELSLKRQQLEQRITLLGQRVTPVAALVYEAALQLEQESLQAIDELEATLAFENCTRLEKLLRVKAVQALLFGEFLSKNTVSSVSHLTMQEAFSAADLTLNYQEGLQLQSQLQAKLSSETLLSTYAIGRVQEKEWLTFLQELEMSARFDELSQFAEFLKQLDRCGVLPLWMNLFFAPARQKAIEAGVSSHALLKTILEHNDSGTQQFLESMQKQKMALTAFEKRLSAFSDEKSFPTAFQPLKELSENFLSLFVAERKESTPLKRLAIIQLMNEMTKLYDDAVKTMKASSQIPPINKVARLKMLLGPYFNMLRIVATEIGGYPGSFQASGSKEKKEYTGFPFFQGETMDTYLNTLQEFLESEKSDPGQLNPSSGFNVAVGTLGSGVLLKRYATQTLEDAFTLTHQNLLACASYLSHELIPTEALKQLALPSYFLAAINKMDTLRSGVQRIGVEVSASQLTLRYNIPLRVHSSNIILNYDEVSDTSTLRLQFFRLGAHRTKRVVAYVTIKQMLGSVALSRAPFVQGEISEIAFSVPREANLQNRLWLECNRILDYTIAQDTLQISPTDLTLLNEKIDQLRQDPQHSVSEVETALAVMLEQAQCGYLGRSPAG